MPPRMLKRPACGIFEVQRKAGERQHDERQADHQRRAPTQNTGACWPVRSCRRLRPDAKDDRADDAERRARSATAAEARP